MDGSRREMILEAKELRPYDVFRAWGRILGGRAPSLSVEITRRCPLSCPGCYAYNGRHLGPVGSLANVAELEGAALVQRVISSVDFHRPLILSIVGGEPLVRRREITELLPALELRGIHSQVVTSAALPIPLEWRRLRRLAIVVSVDGLPPEHDKRRAPATYERILHHIRGHRITVHCTVTRQMTEKAGYLGEFLDFWSQRPETAKIWISLYTPQVAEVSSEVLPPDVRSRLIGELSALSGSFPKLELPAGVLQAFRQPPSDPGHCVFALTTKCISADLTTAVVPCQLGGIPDCSQCGCIAGAAMAAVSRHRLSIGIRAGTIFDVSRTLGLQLMALRRLDFSRRHRLSRHKLPADAAEHAVLPGHF